MTTRIRRPTLSVKRSCDGRDVETDFVEIAAVTRRLLRAHAVLICGSNEPQIGADEILAIDGLEESDYTDVIDHVAAAVLPARGVASNDRATVHRSTSARGATLSAELIVAGRSAGALHAFARDDQWLDGEAETLLAALARQTALAMEHRGLRRDPATMAAALETLERLDDLTLSAQSAEEMTIDLASTIAPLVDATIAAISVSDDHRGVLQMLPGSFGASADIAASYQVSRLDPRSNAARVLMTRHPYMTNAARGDPAILQDYVEAFGVERLITTPLVLAGRAIGVLHIGNKLAPFTVEDVGKVELFAPRVATAVEHARLLLMVRRREALEAILSDVAVAIASGCRAESFLVEAMEKYCAVTEASLVAMTMNEGSPTIVRRMSVRRSLESAFLAEAGETGKTVRSALATPRGAGDPGWAALHIPVLVSNRRVAALSVLRQRGESFAMDESAALSRLSDLAALTWTTERYQQERAKMAKASERQRIADDLHDTVAQMLFTGQLTLESVLERPDLGREERASISQALRLVASGQTAIREVIQELSEPHRADLTTRVSLLVRELEQEYGLNVHLEISPNIAEAESKLRKPVADLVVRVAAEAITNAAKHAVPCRLRLTLRKTRDDRLLLTALDDGIGLPERKDQHRHGLGSLRSALRGHGGMLRLSRGRHGGTKLTASVPL